MNLDGADPARPQVSVIVPTHNRRESLLRMLSGLFLQSGMRPAEVIVVCDGCEDGTAEALRRLRAPLELRVIEQNPARGAAAARNHGAEEARGELLLFLDDDLVPLADVVKAHVNVHRGHENRVVVGPYFPVQVTGSDFLQIEIRNWWERTFAAMSDPGHRFTFRDLVSGNLSMAAEMFRRVGGFDDRFEACGAEDWELGVRILKQGAEMHFEPTAVAEHHHHETMDLQRSLRRAWIEGRGIALIGQLHPELLPGLWDPGAADAAWVNRRLRGLARRGRRPGRLLTSLLRVFLPTLEWARFRRRWRHVYGAVRWFFYWEGFYIQQGQARATGSRPAGGEPRRCVELSIDLSGGLEQAERILDREQPERLVVRFGKRELGAIDAVPGAERLRGRHLRRILSEELSGSLMKELDRREDLGIRHHSCA